jgi:SET and MYND domain-containing protein
VLARLHLNTFKVDAVFPMDWDNPYAAAAALMQPGSSSGSALYLLASLFNHSCEPSVNVNFPGNDATAVFTAARRISAGEQLFISYTDTEQEVDVRQEYLAFAYGFKCQCTRCREEVAELRKGMPLQPQ